VSEFDQGLSQNDSDLNNEDHNFTELQIVELHVPCWRCGHHWVAGTEWCRHCQAKLTKQSSQRNEEQFILLNGRMHPLFVGLAFSAAMFTISMFMRLLSETPYFQNGDEVAGMVFMGIWEVMDFLLVLASVLYIGADKTCSLMKFSKTTCFGWAALLLLPLIMLINYAYHGIVAEWIGWDVLDFGYVDYHNYFWIILILYCVQPAIVEEVFFRGVMGYCFETVTSPRVSIVLMAILFSLAHVADPISMPYFFFIGLYLGLLRYLSGGLMVPILAHFLHNGAVTWIEILQQ